MAYGWHMVTQACNDRALLLIPHSVTGEDPQVRSQWIDYSTFDTLVTWKVHEAVAKHI